MPFNGLMLGGLGRRFISQTNPHLSLMYVTVDSDSESGFNITPHFVNSIQFQFQFQGCLFGPHIFTVVKLK